MQQKPFNPNAYFVPSSSQATHGFNMNQPQLVSSNTSAELY